MKTFTTPNGKEVQIIKNSRGDTVIQFATGGELPSYLTGILLLNEKLKKQFYTFYHKKKNKRLS